MSSSASFAIFCFCALQRCCRVGSYCEDSLGVGVCLGSRCHELGFAFLASGHPCVKEHDGSIMGAWEEMLSIFVGGCSAGQERFQITAVKQGY